jgi:nuclease-like protein
VLRSAEVSATPCVMAYEMQMTGVGPKEEWPDDRLEVAREVVRRVLVYAEESFLADPDLSLGTWLARVQETISVASATALGSAEAGRTLESDDVAAETLGVFADLCAETVRAAARLAPASASSNPKEAVITLACRDDWPSRIDWTDVKDSLIRCQIAIEPLASGLRDGDRPMVDAAGEEAYLTFLEVIRQGFSVVYGLCVGSPQEPASVIGMPGRSVREASRRTYGKATLVGLKAAVVFGVALVVAANGALAVGALLALGAAVLVRKSWALRNSAYNYRRGAVGEERVGAILGQLPAPWLVEHDVAKGEGGNVDHIVHSPSATFSVDTKLTRFRAKDLAQAHRHAQWVASRFGSQTRIVPVICEQRSDRVPQQIEGVWVVGASRVVGFLMEQSAAAPGDGIFVPDPLCRS